MCTSTNDLALILNASQVAEFLGISRSLAYKLFRRKDFPTIQIGHRKLVRREALLAWLDAHTQGREEVANNEEETA
ncbi:helix-turn-helix transcriptional regulator [Butyricicoccus pullicaecorum]|uniref:Helix-turn-helix domain-containing protein n=1 Tax=Butyricicoccus pullicaecorum TaxID=501571 RepID=A0A1Y4L5J6_9FIRM|nr:helix-turn-helix domain-containing protein [Butyricicoccus pullicaecorum]OUP52038.1 hypothetical protein B5F15_16625 [Butyricicoccus pullicaecorum]HJF51554.1 helix-turn-helix domain-containing protein [Butyricicoccus pullicaecorum]